MEEAERRFAEAGDQGKVAQVRNTSELDLDLEDLGDVEVKNIERPIRAFHVVLNEKAAALATAVVAQPPDKRSRWGRVAAAAALSLAVIAGVAWWQPWAPDFEPAISGHSQENIYKRIKTTKTRHALRWAIHVSCIRVLNFLSKGRYRPTVIATTP